jgi:hypothetical protein
MSWNYRIIKDNDGLRIFDVYYDEAGHPIATHAVPSYVYGDTVDDLREQLALMSEALVLPILDENEIGNAKNPDAAPK